MADGYKLWKDCEYCLKGKQKQWVGAEGGGLSDVDCSQCGGTGYRFFGWCSVDTFTLPANLPEPE